MSRNVDEDDARAGTRLRSYRVLRGMTQSDLARKIGVTYQQQHKYEHAINRITVGRLLRALRILHVPPAEFFEDFDSQQTEPSAHELSTLRFLQLAASLSPDHRAAIAKIMRTLEEVPE